MSELSGRLLAVPCWWRRLVENHPGVPTVFSLAGLAVLVVLLAPGSKLSAAFQSGIPISDGAAHASVQGMLGALRENYHELIPLQLRTWVWQLYTNPILYTVVPFLLLLEVLFPCNPKQGLVGRGFVQDAVWFVTSLPLNAMVLGTAYGFLKGYYAKHLDFLTIKSAVAWPVALQLTAGFLVIDFLGWFHHFVRHKIYPLWIFHAVHHSQRELNLFTDNRVHVVEGLVTAVISFIPLMMFQVSALYGAALIGVIIPLYTRFLHANLKIDLGVLGYLLASPQFHRVHHSLEPEHRDRNFGVVLSVWDRLFGTACRSNTVYPDTGIDDPAFPLEHEFPSRSVPANWAHQMVYPFTQLFRMILTGRLRR
jgi:sterol desaturase/sphingolipid hydroxylase (fatty acid hydroxylase superfamily)